MTRIDAFSDVKPDADSSMTARDVKNEANGSVSPARTPVDETAPGKESAKKIHVGWSLLAFGLFCAVAWGVIFLILRAI